MISADANIVNDIDNIAGDHNNIYKEYELKVLIR